MVLWRNQTDLSSNARRSNVDVPFSNTGQLVIRFTFFIQSFLQETKQLHLS
jgi:hypothetical protein